MRLAQAAELAQPGNVLAERETDDEAVLGKIRALLGRGLVGGSIR